MDAAWKAGVRYFDAARSYGLAERFLANWLVSRSIPPDDVTIGSKWGYTYTAQWRVHAEAHEVKDHSLPVLRRQWEETQALLGSYLDIYHIHSATIESGVLENADVLRELARLRDGGTVIGLSLSGAGQGETLERAIEINVGDAPLFRSVEATWNLLEPSAAAVLAIARDAGMGVIIKESLANGRLTERNQEAAFSQKLSALKSEAERVRAGVDALAIAACLAQPFADVVLSGAVTVPQLLSNLDALKIAPDARVMDMLLKQIAEPKEDYWARRKGMAWN